MKVKSEELKKIIWTPETLSASYGRISRSPDPVDELRKKARAEVEKSRKSNKAIIFDMGHSSVAEHAVFNIDIIGISRYLAERLEKNRLVSFTEKSQRYIKIGYDNYYPSEFNEDKDFLKKYKALVNELFDAYNIIHDKILPYFIEMNKDIEPESKEYRDIINLAKEDARYILPLTTLTQLGMTVNSRSLEKIIRKLLSEDLVESKELAKKIFEAVDGYAPSLVKYTTPTEYEKQTYQNLKEIIGNERTGNALKEVSLIEYDKNILEKILAGLVVKSTNIDFVNALKIVSSWNEEKKKKVFLESFKNINSYDSVLREFEMSNFEFNILISATAFAQMKRHRMATIIDGDYSPELGLKIPESILINGQKDFFMEKTEKINSLFNEAKEKWPSACYYILSNSHRKNMILKCNFRELVHISRLRSDMHAQWDIRNISEEMMNEVKPKLGLIGNILCGKDRFDEMKKI